MKNLVLLLGFTGIMYLNASAQMSDTQDTLNQEVFTVVEKMPEFPGGENLLMSYLQKHLRYPELARDNGIQGKVWVEFIIDRFGNVKNVKVTKGIGGGCDEEAGRVIESMPRWSPGIHNGKPVNVQYRLPIIFTLR